MLVPLILALAAQTPAPATAAPAPPAPAPPAPAPTVRPSGTAADVAIPTDMTRWRELGQGGKMRAFFDRGSVSRQGRMLRYSGRIVYSTPDQQGAVAVNHRGEIDCDRRTFRILGFTTHGPTGAVLLNYTTPTAPEPVPDPSPNEAIRAEFCR